MRSKTMFDNLSYVTVNQRLIYVVGSQWNSNFASSGSTGLTLPPALMRDLGLAAGQLMTLRKTPSGSILLTPKLEKRKYSAAELNAQCNLKVPMQAD